jgi:hypothetical protein
MLAASSKAAIRNLRKFTVILEVYSFFCAGPGDIFLQKKNDFPCRRKSSSPANKAEGL